MVAPVTYFRYLLLVAVLYCPSLFGQSTDKNFVLTRSYKKEKTTVSGNVYDATQEVSYFDGLGRPLQSINAHASPSITSSRPADLISHTEYDAMGRVSKVYAAYPQNYSAAPATGNGRYMGGAASNSVNFYDNSANFDVNNNRAYALTEYEPTPLNRVSKQFAVGSDKAVEFIYGINSSEVKRYDVNGSGGLSENGNHEPNRLTYTETKDENGNRTREYKDKSGVIVLKRIYNDNDELSTYYVYDDLSRLRFVLQPEYQGGSADRINKYAFKYNYNDRGLMTSKYVPGGGTTTMTYDNKDRLETSTDGNGKVTYFKYDNLNRVIETGERSGGNDLPLVKTFYDNYSFTGKQDFVGNYGNNYPSSYRSNVMGLITGTAMRILNPNNSYSVDDNGNPFWLYSTTYYDDRFNVIQTIRDLYDLGGTSYEHVVRQLRFDGRVEKELTKQKVSTGENTVEKLYEYDHADRLLSTRYIVKSGTTEMKNIVVAANRYDAAGRMRKKFLNSTNASNFREQLDYSYVPRGWMSKMLGKTGAGDNFGVELKYANASNPQYNGNIGEMSWKRTGNANWGGYNFTYDKANRLTNATGTHQEQISYDLNGNIKTLNRWIDGNQKDGLTYVYENGNQLTKVTDSQGSEGFNNGSSGENTDYYYDGAGNATSDANRGIGNGGLKYNILNLPREISVNSKTLSYYYDATGSKLRMWNNMENTKYAGAFEYDNSSYLTRIATEEGQISITNNGANISDYTFQYYLKDHLGNTRVVMNEAGTIVQETEYLPFGLAIPRMAGTNKYLYNGKEKQPETGFLDYGARQYDPTIGRWMTLDPKTELLEMSSPYAYSLNNPANFIDKDGQLPIFINGRVASNDERANRLYWDEQLLRTIANSGIPNPGGEIHFMDGDVYRRGGIINTYGTATNAANEAMFRKQAGKGLSETEFNWILEKLARDPKSGKITEKIQIYTHSRGAAYGAGFTDALLEMIKKHADEFEDPDNVIDFVLNLAPHQSNQITANKKIKSYSIDHGWDMLSGNDMHNNTGFRTNTESGNFRNSHRNKTFATEVGAFIKSYQKSKGDNNKLISDFVNQMRSYGIEVTVN